jgi:hypothetical protein
MGQRLALADPHQQHGTSQLKVVGPLRARGFRRTWLVRVSERPLRSTLTSGGTRCTRSKSSSLVTLSDSASV